MSYARVPSFGAVTGGANLSSSGVTASGSSGGGSGGDSEICRLATASNCLQAIAVFAKAVVERNAGKAVSPTLLNSACERTLYNSNTGKMEKSINFACLPVVPYMAQLLAQPAPSAPSMALQANLFALRAQASTPPPAPAPVTGPAPAKATYPGGLQVIPRPSAPPVQVVYEGEAPPPPAPATGIPTWALIAGGVAVVGVAVFLLK